MLFTLKYFRAAALGYSLIAVAAGGALASDIQIKEPWTRAPATGATVAAGFMTIENKGNMEDRLKGASSPAAEKVDIHEMRMDGEVMKMRALPDGIVIKPGETVTLKPGALHLMLVGLKQSLLPGEAISVTLTFAKAGQIAVSLPVQGLGATGPAPASEGPPQINY